MKTYLNLLGLLLLPGISVLAQSKTAPTAPAAVVTTIEGITNKQFQTDTTYAALSKEDETLLAKEPVANWGLPQESDGMQYYNLVIGTRSYQLLVNKSPKAEFPTATLLRYADPKSKPEPIARGLLKPKTEKAK
ncbi:hypothetical protein ACO2Q8_28130 [Larkinella sp. VNQ87]|uniref:hypothetical protein n=1 Tax=Larkinella sp. VNQ87 TaxID=3400921 RepID=UPI003C055C65